MLVGVVVRVFVEALWRATADVGHGPLAHVLDAEHEVAVRQEEVLAERRLAARAALRLLVDACSARLFVGGLCQGGSRSGVVR